MRHQIYIPNMNAINVELKLITIESNIIKLREG